MTAVSPARQPIVSGTAFALRDAWPWPAFERLARAGEGFGYRAVFLPEIASRDAFAALAALAGATSRLSLGTGVVPMGARRAGLTAMSVATVHERSGGRAVLGIGTGPARPGALDELEAQVREIRSILDRTVGSAPDGSVLSLDRPVPIWIAALGPRAVALAGRVADGVLLNWCTPERVADARARVAEAAESAGRDPTSITVAAYIRAAIGDGEPGSNGARAALAEAAGEYSSYPAYRRQFDAMGVGAAAATAAHDPRALDAVAPLLDAVCLTGERAHDRLAAYREAGCDLPVVYPVPFGDDRPGSVVSTLEALAPP